MIITLNAGNIKEKIESANNEVQIRSRLVVVLDRDFYMKLMQPWPISLNGPNHTQHQQVGNKI